MAEISTATRLELVRAVGERYRTVSADEKSRILDEFVALTGYHRKHAIRVLNGFTGIPPAARRTRLRLYDEAVRQALIVSLGSVRSHLWKTAQATAPRPTPRPGTSRAYHASTLPSANSCSQSAPRRSTGCCPVRVLRLEVDEREPGHRRFGAAFRFARLPIGTIRSRVSSRSTSSCTAARAWRAASPRRLSSRTSRAAGPNASRCSCARGA